ncbi:MAG: hypothetical protein ABSG64_07690 [Solirubrobacteraceae bacterium]|jgi:hypothetical protein
MELLPQRYRYELELSGVDRRTARSIARARSAALARIDALEAIEIRAQQAIGAVTQVSMLEMSRLGPVAAALTAQAPDMAPLILSKLMTGSAAMDRRIGALDRRLG